MSSNRIAGGGAVAGKEFWMCSLRTGRNHGNSIFGASKPVARRKVRRESLTIEAGSIAGGDTSPKANTIPTITTEQTNRINTAKRVPLRLQSSSIDRGFEENSVTTAILRSDDTIGVSVGTRDSWIGLRKHEFTALVVELQTHLQLSRRRLAVLARALTCDLAISRVGTGRVRNAKDNVVEEVERFGSEFEVSPLSEP